MRSDPDFQFLRTASPEKFNVLMDLAEKADENARLLKSPVVILNYDNFSGSTDISNHAWDDYDHPKYVALREKYRLAEIAGQGPSEFDKMRRVLDWVATRWKHSGDNTANERVS